MSEQTPKLWSDFDGTAVAVVRKINPRNWSKYPLPSIAGYSDFLRGVRASGVEIAGVVSRRPDILARRMATSRSITKLGFSEFFGKRDQIVHAGSDSAKGRFVARQSEASAIGMLEDKPHHLGSIIIGALIEPSSPDISHHPILLGVVNHRRSQEHIEVLHDMTTKNLKGDINISQTGESGLWGLEITCARFLLDVVQLAPYTNQSGEEFGNRLQALSVETA